MSNTLQSSSSPGGRVIFTAAAWYDRTRQLLPIKSVYASWRRRQMANSNKKVIINYCTKVSSSSSDGARAFWTSSRPSPSTCSTRTKRNIFPWRFRHGITTTGTKPVGSFASPRVQTLRGRGRVFGTAERRAAADGGGGGRRRRRRAVVRYTRRPCTNLNPGRCTY